MVLEIKPGENPANKNQIELLADGERVENARILEAYNDHGKKRIIVEVTNGITLESAGSVRSEVQRESKKSKKRTDRGDAAVSES